MIELYMFVYLTIGDKMERFEQLMPPTTTREECMVVAEDVAQSVTLLTENKGRAMFGCEERRGAI